MNPAAALPKVDCLLIIQKDEEMAFGNVNFLQSGQATLDQGAADPLMAMGLINRQVMQVAAPAIASTQDCSYQSLSLPGAKAHTWVMGQVPCDVLFRIGLAQAYAFR